VRLWDVFTKIQHDYLNIIVREIRGDKDVAIFIVQ
jgi:hypothetical protein